MDFEFNCESVNVYRRHGFSNLTVEVTDANVGDLIDVVAANELSQLIDQVGVDKVLNEIAEKDLLRYIYENNLLKRIISYLGKDEVLDEIGFNAARQHFDNLWHV